MAKQNVFSVGPLHQEWDKLIKKLGQPKSDDGNIVKWPCGCELHGETLFACETHAK